MSQDRSKKAKLASVRARQDAIGRELQKIFEHVINEPLPDEFVDLLKRIDEAALLNGKKPH